MRMVDLRAGPYSGSQAPSQNERYNAWGYAGSGTAAAQEPQAGAVTLAELGTSRALTLIAGSLGFTTRTVADMLTEFDPERLPREPWVYQPG
jgi:hypothetical protein